MIPLNSRFSARLDARTKLIAVCAALIICVSTPAPKYAAFGAYFLVLVSAVALSGVSFRILARRLLVALPMVLLCAAFIPFLHPDSVGGGYSLGIGGLRVSNSGLLVLWNITAKAVLGVGLVTLLTETTPFPLLLRGLEQLRCPRIFLLLLGFCHRFLFVLRDEALRMKRAADARGFQGRWLWHAPVIGRMIGSLFLRGYERGERVYLAMASRGFNGGMPAAETPAALARTDRVFLACTLTVFLALRVALP
jgi:cobalt/nickel transport system permease protein